VGSGDKGIVPLSASANAARGLRRKAIVAWHGIVAWVRGPGFLARTLLSTISVGLLIWPLFQSGWKRGAVASTLWISVGLWKAWRELSPKHMQLLRRNYLARKLKLYKLLQASFRGQTMSTAEVDSYRQEALELIASYVRDHRLDTGGTKIFANLLIREGDDVVVIARDRAHRRQLARYPATGMLVAVAISTGEPQVCGDTWLDYPDIAKDKPYRSILVIPVRLGHEVVGAVSIDSARTYHFDREFRDLVEYLNPYVCLLAWTLGESRAKALLKGSVGSQGSLP
jgi:hypothetical protein